MNVRECVSCPYFEVSAVGAAAGPFQEVACVEDGQPTRRPSLGTCGLVSRALLVLERLQAAWQRAMEEAPGWNLCPRARSIFNELLQMAKNIAPPGDPVRRLHPLPPHPTPMPVEVVYPILRELQRVLGGWAPDCAQRWIDGLVELLEQELADAARRAAPPGSDRPTA
ncbi:MAG: hypothetical protein HYV08_04720 [Deltaproteobacteria bacterium]|nr:hypothetical protein [Deltaproteobacteria bacterium]MBI3079191.1 hypothetical protein [Deltaproteobacteria bacterium]